MAVDRSEHAPYDRRRWPSTTASARSTPAFLHLERLEYPMHVGAVSVFEGQNFFSSEGRFRIDEVRGLVLSRLPLLPRFRRRLMLVPYDQGRPIWVDDDRFRHHIPRSAHRAAASRIVGAARRAHHACAGEPARPRASAVGAVVCRGTRRRPCRPHPEDAPRAGRRRFRCRRRDAAARHVARLRRRRVRGVDARAGTERTRSC